MIEKFTGFYTFPPFWAISAIDLQDPNINIASHFTELMSEIVYKYSSDTFSFQVCKDGMLQLRVNELEKKSPFDIDAKAEDINKKMIVIEERLERTDICKFDIDGKIEWWRKYLDYFNCLYLLLDSAVINANKDYSNYYFNFAEVTNKDMFCVSFEDGQEKGSSIAPQSITSKYLMARYRSLFKLHPQDDPCLSGRLVVPKQVFEEVAAKFEIIASCKSLVSRLSGIAKGLSEYKMGNYPTSLILAWFVIESIVTKKWDVFLESKNQAYPNGSKRINADRKDNLAEGRDYPISVILNILELNDILAFPLYKKIDTLRRYRNKVIHQDTNYNCKPEHCVMALEVALKLSLEGTPLAITLNLSQSIRG